jgi:hypothetical protein
MNSFKTSLWPLFLVSAASVGFEVQLTRYFAIASWSEYGYWVISIVMVGFAAGGIVLSLLKDFFEARAAWFLFWIPVLLMAAGALGFYAVTLVPFNPLEFQNADLWFSQLINVWIYYAVLFPFFFLTGIYISLCFVHFADRIPSVYAADLMGAGAGSLLLMALLYLIHPFHFLTALIPLLFLASLLGLRGLESGKTRWSLIILGVFLLSEAASVFLNQADYCEYKAVYPPLHVAGNKVIGQILSPRGQYLALDNFTERVDVDLSNNYSLLKVNGPPTAFGIYLDGNRITELPKSLPVDLSYSKATLDVLPYFLRQRSRCLLIGTRGGFKIREVLTHEARQVDALEPDPNLYSFVMKEHLELEEGSQPNIHLYAETPAGFLRNHSGPYDIIDISSEFLNQGDANKFAFTQEALRQYFAALAPGGIISIPSSIREFTVYALKEEESALEVLRFLGVQYPEKHLILYRSAWSAQFLIFKDEVRPADLAMLNKFCSRRSFDTSYFPGIKPAKLQIWNDLPPISFDENAAYNRSDKASDSLMDDSLKLLSGDHDAFVNGYFFNLKPSTLDRPFFYSILRLSKLKQILSNITLIPREEIGYLINLAVLAQSILLALLVLILPLVFRKQTHFHGMTGVAFYFAGLGLGFLFIEIFMIEKASYFLGDRAMAFTLVLCGMLFFSGLGSWVAGRLFWVERGLTLALAGTGIWLVFSFLGLNGLLSAFLSSPVLLKCALLLAVLAPVSFALGMPFSLGLSRLKAEGGMVPWAWALNGAFSVVATPLANLLANSAGYSLLLGLSFGLYLIVFLFFPKLGTSTGAMK